VITAADGSYVASNVPSGQVTITSELEGFKPARRTLQFDQTPKRVDMPMAVSTTAENVTVSAAAPLIDTAASKTTTINMAQEAQARQKKDENEPPSQNVQNLQRRVAGVLPVRVDVPRAGTSHRFVKPLVIDEETQVTFRYKRR